MSDFEEDEFGRVCEERSRRLFEQAVFQRAELEWSAELVKTRLAEAARGCERLVGRVGPSQKTTTWINYELLKNLSDFDRNCRAAGVREKTRPPDRMRLPMSEIETSRVEDAVAWPMRYLAGHENELKIMQIWCWTEAKDQPFSRFHKAVCAHRSTALRRLDRGFDIICAGLIRDRILP